MVDVVLRLLILSPSACRSQPSCRRFSLRRLGPFPFFSIFGAHGGSPRSPLAVPRSCRRESGRSHRRRARHSCGRANVRGATRLRCGCARRTRTVVGVVVGGWWTRAARCLHRVRRLQHRRRGRGGFSFRRDGHDPEGTVRGVGARVVAGGRSLRAAVLFPPPPPVAPAAGVCGASDGA